MKEYNERVKVSYWGSETPVRKNQLARYCKIL